MAGEPGIVDGRPPLEAEPSSPSPQELLGGRMGHRRLVASLVFVLLSVAGLYFVLPKVLGLQQTWNRIHRGDPAWFGIAATLELASFASYVALFRGLFARLQPRIDWRESYQITMAGLAATRLLASAGAGGIALTAWALRRSGLGPRLVACRMIAFMVLLYGVYMAALIVGGVGLYLGAFKGPAPFAVTVVPAILAAVLVAIFVGMTKLPGDLERLVHRWTSDRSLPGRVARRLAALPATAATGIRTAIEVLRSRDLHLLGAIGWWGFDIAVLWACFHAFGSAPPQAVIVMAYFIGMLGNTLPLPGGIGGVDGGMIGAFTAFGTNVELSVVAVLAYRVFAFWLPTLPGAVAYLQLRRTVHRWQALDAPTRAVPPRDAPSYT